MRSFALRSPGFNLVVKWIGFVIQYCTHYQLRPKKNRPLRFGSPSLSLSLFLSRSLHPSLSVSLSPSLPLSPSLSLCLSLSLSPPSLSIICSLYFSISMMFFAALSVHPCLSFSLALLPSFWLSLSLTHSLPFFLWVSLSLSHSLSVSLSSVSMSVRDLAVWAWGCRDRSTCVLV